MPQTNSAPRNKWQNKCIDRKCKNKHAKSRNKMPRKSSNSLKQEFRNEKFNLQLFNRIYTNKTNQHYSLHKYLESGSIYEDIHMILSHSYDQTCMDENDTNTETNTDLWQCNRCTFINNDRVSQCQICDHSYQNNCTTSDTQSISSSDSIESITTHSSLSSFITNKKIKIKRKRTKKAKKPVQTFKFNDKSFRKFKKYMKKRNTSVIAYKKEANNAQWNGSKIEKRKANAMKLFGMYKTLYLSQNQSRDEIVPIIKNMTAFIPKKHTKTLIPQPCTNTLCKVCYIDTNEDKELELVPMSQYCTHCMICTDCFAQYLQITVKDDENILPWLLCPAQDCKAPISVDLLLKYTTIDSVYTFAKSFLYKHLQRSAYWTDCPDLNDRQCKFGWIIMDNDRNSVELKCESCGCAHIVTEEKVSDGFDELIKNGIMRECPECSYPAMKDYGMCNVMHCGKCSVYWNWRTKETGTSSNEVKQKARNTGTLWEAGELSYQQDLQRNNVKEFISLLARNGIKYDPNYRRGS